MSSNSASARAWRKEGRALATIAVYSMKGGVGKTTVAVNLAWASASLSARRTLIWDLDAQAAASFILAPRRASHDQARAVLERDVDPESLIQPTAVPRLDILPADASLRALDTVFAEIDRKNRLRRLVETLDRRYDRIILDCPPGLGVTSDQIIRGASLILVPMIPSTLSRRAYFELRQHLEQEHKGPATIFPIFTMVDRRRTAHRAALAADPGCPVIPMASAVEKMADQHAAVGEYAPGSPATKAFAHLWKILERRLKNGLEASAAGAQS